ncbi:hypothetical protein Tco_1470235 [Tanacetum coccineum]
MFDRRYSMQPMFSSAVRFSSRSDGSPRMDPTTNSQPPSTDNEQEAGQNNSNMNENSPAGSKNSGSILKMIFLEDLLSAESSGGGIAEIAEKIRYV